MECFEIGCCFKSYAELTEKLKQYCSETNTKFTTKDCRLIKDEFMENVEAKNRLMYTDLKIICVHGRTNRPKKTESKRKRTERNVQTGCPAYFRLKLIQSGIALQIVALNIKHNHPLEPPKIEEVETEGRKTKRQRTSKMKAEKRFKDELKSEDGSVSGTEEEFIISYVEDDNSEDQDIHFDLKGFCAPVFTPFNEDMSLNMEEIPKYAKYLSDNGITAVLVNSVIGEGTFLTLDERKLVIKTWHEVKTSNQHLMLQLGGCPLTEMLELAKYAETLGVNSLLCLPEILLKPKTTEDLINYLKNVCEAAPKTPLLYYHDPTLTGVNIDVREFLEEACEKVSTFRGIYHCSKDLDSVIDFVNIENRKYSIFFGADKLLAGAFVLGFDCAIVPFTNLFPEYCLEILRAVNESDLAKAREIQKKLSEAYLQITRYGNSISTMKSFMNIITKVNVGPPRPPLTSLTEEQINDIKAHMSFT